MDGGPASSKSKANDSDAAQQVGAGRGFSDTQDLTQDLAGKSVRGGVSLLASEIVCNVFRLLGTVILARLLTPEHFGLVGMVIVITAFGELFKDLGLGTATIQKKEITPEQISTLFWVNSSIGLGITLVLVAAAPAISWFYQDSRLLWITLAISSTFLLGGLTVQHQALLRREMQFSKLAFIQILATGLSTIIGIVMAWQNYEYWALVGKEVSRAVIQTGATWLFSHWLPGRPVRGAGVRSMFQTGAHVTGFNILAFISRSLDQILLGKFWGPESVGLYKQSGVLLMLPTSLFSHPITYMLTPALSALQGDPDRYRNYYRKVVSLLAFGYIPIIVFVAVHAESLIILVLGTQWAGASPVLQILAFPAIVDTVSGTCGLVMVTYGRTKEYLQLGAVQAVFLIIAMLIGIQWGMYGVAWAALAFALLTNPFWVWTTCKNTPVSPQLFYGAVGWPLFASVVMGLLLVAVRNGLQPSNVFVELSCSAALAPLAYCGVWLLIPGGRDEFLKYISYGQLAYRELLQKLGLGGAVVGVRS